jgi:uncharacterized protein (DUF302 family)
MKKVLRSGFDEALARVPDALKTEGFGVLTEIDVKDTLHKKLGADFRRYRILGACNPPLAHRALQADLDVGVLLPCNVVVYEGDDGRAVVTSVDPTLTPAVMDSPDLREVAETVRGKLARVLERLD